MGVCNYLQEGQEVPEELAEAAAALRGAQRAYELEAGAAYSPDKDTQVRCGPICTRPASASTSWLLLSLPCAWSSSQKTVFMWGF